MELALKHVCRYAVWSQYSYNIHILVQIVKQPSPPHPRYKLILGVVGQETIADPTTPPVITTPATKPQNLSPKRSATNPILGVVGGSKQHHGGTLLVDSLSNRSWSARDYDSVVVVDHVSGRSLMKRGAGLHKCRLVRGQHVLFDHSRLWLCVRWGGDSGVVVEVIVGVVVEVIVGLWWLW